MKCNFSLKSFKQELRQQVAPIINNSDISDVDKKQTILDTIANISKKMQISTPTDVRQAFDLVQGMLKYLNPAQVPDSNLILASFKAWKHKILQDKEDTSSDRLNKEKVEKFNDDVWDSLYGNAMNAKIRAKQHANRVGINSLLYNDNGIIQNVHDLNVSIQQEQEKLLQIVLNYLKTRVSQQDSEIFQSTMYKDGKYTGIVEKLENVFNKILNKKNFDVSSLNRDFNQKNFERLDAYSAWVILTNFDTILEQNYGKAVSINPDSAKYEVSLNKYGLAGGSNVYNTWRTSEEIDLRKEINNISQQIVQSIPLIYDGTTTPTEENIKFNEFIYIVSKIKEIPYKSKSDFIFSITDPHIATLSQETKNYINGKSILNIINNISSNPQEILPVIFEIFSNSKLRDSLITQGVIDNNTFYDIDLDLINSINLGLFNGNNSLRFIQNKSGFKGINYYAFIGQTVSSIYKAGFLQYFRDPEGKIYIRNMFDQSINNIEYSIKNAINSINSQLLQQTYNPSEYDFSEIKPQLQDGVYSIEYNNIKYNVTIVNSQPLIREITKINEYIQNTELIGKIVEKIKENITPEYVNFSIKDFHKGILNVSVNIKNGDITYTVGNQEISGFNNEDYKSLSNTIQEVLKQNFDIDLKYFDAFCKGDNVGNATTKLMKLVTRVLTNQYISNKYLKGLTPNDVRLKVKEIYGDSNPTIPTFNKNLNEINFLTEAESGILNELAQAKALVTGRLTSSQILDGEGNSLASSSLSRLISTIPYQVAQQVLSYNSASSDFSIWKHGVYLGIQQLKELQDNTKNSSKALTEFSAKEMLESSIFIDFVHSLFDSKSRTSPVGNGIIPFLPSENSDKTYIGRMLINTNNIQIGESSLFDLLKKKEILINNSDFMNLLSSELGNFYLKAFDNINYDWYRVNTELTNLVTSLNLNGASIPLGDISYGKWSYLELVAQYLNKTPLQLIKELTTEYNNQNPQNPIVLIDQVHYISDKNGKLKTNISFEENLNRFQNPDLLYNFIQQQEVDLLKSLLKNEISVENNTDVGNLVDEKWIDPYTNKIILAYENIYDLSTGETISKPIRRIQDIQEGFDINSVHSFTLNPIISNYNILNYFFTQEFMNSTVGAYYAHPSKYKPEDPNNPNPLLDEKSRKNAQDKRNVSFTASMHPFLLNLIQGIPSEINIAIMPDIGDEFQTISGDIFDEIAPFDGATFANPFYSILENNSLGGARVGLNKKTFTHYYDHRTGTGGIIKTAEFPLTNNLIRNSKFYQTMMKNMTNRIWLTKNGSNAVVDITKDYDGDSIVFTNPSDQEGQLYYQDSNGNYYAILSIKSIGNNQYVKTVQQVDKHGKPTGKQLLQDNNGNHYQYLEDQKIYQNINDLKDVRENITPIEVNTNYKLWKLFGGERIVEMKIGDSTFTPSEYSIELVVRIMNSTVDTSSKVQNVKYQSDIWQPLKHSDIHIMPTIGAVKQGAGNINTLNAYDIADSSKINFMRIRMNQAGIQLDKEHHADGEDLSIMTQVLSACASRGYTQQQCEDMYNALAALARNGIKEYIHAFDEFFKSPNQQTKDAYQKVILDTLIDAFAHNANSSQMLQIVTQELLEKAKLGKDIEFKELNTIPYSDPSVFRRLHSTISVALTRAAIKIKVDGILSVLQPSYRTIRLYDNKLLGNFNNNESIIALQRQRDLDKQYNIRDRVSELRIGRTYKIIDGFGNIQLTTIKSHNSYYSLRDKLENNYVMDNYKPFVEGDTEFNGIPIQYTTIGENGGRKVGARALVDSVGNRTIQIDLEALKEKWNEKAWRNPLRSDFIGIVDFQSEQDLINWVLLHEYAHHKFQDNLNPNYDRKFKENRANSFATQNLIRINPNYNIQKIIEQFAPVPELGFEGGRELAAYNVTFKSVDGRSFNVYDLDSVRNLANLKAIKASKTEINQALSNIQKDLNILGNKKGILNIHGEQIELDSNSVNIEPYEIVMPKIFKDIFGLETYDDLQKIKEDSEFFTKRLLSRIQVEIPRDRYSLALLRLNGKHTYILDASQAVEVPGEFERKTISLIKDKNKLYRVDRKGNKLYEMKKGDEVWEQTVNGRKIEVIVTNNIAHYIQTQKFNTLSVSPKGDYEKILGLLSKSKKKSIQNWILAFREESGITKNVEIALMNMALQEDLENHPLRDYFKHLGKTIHTSFLKSLKVVAARIPAQSMQSFMPMRVVAFDAPDINTAYVNTAHFLFQGSDLDIDAVSLASFAFDQSGQYIMHSPFANIENSELLEASENLPFPTGSVLEVNSKEKIDYSKYIGIGNFDITKPFNVIQGKEGTEIHLNISTPQSIANLSELIRICNKLGFMPEALNIKFNKIIPTILSYINQHNEFINDNSAEEFSKNYIVTSMYNIGANPINLIESQQAMDTITKPLKNVANSTKKAKESNDSLGNPASCATNVEGIVQNMSGKKSVGICAVGLKSYFALTARYNEVLANGNTHEIERLKSDISIAKERFRTLANIYTTNDINAAVLGDIYYLLDQGQDQALVLSALLSLATDNAKELALDKLNASNFLGMYIFGITIGVDFKTLADIISSDTGKVLNSLMGKDSISEEEGLNIQNIFDYIELGPELIPTEKLSNDGGLVFTKYLGQDSIYTLAYDFSKTLQEKLDFLEKLKVKEDFVLNNLIEKAQKYISYIDTINKEQIIINRPDGTQTLLTGTDIYQNFKKLNAGAEELRKQGQLLHINQGLESQYLKSINYIQNFESCVYDRKYSEYRESKREAEKHGQRKPKSPSDEWKFNFSDFVRNASYREAWIDIYEGKINETLYEQDEIYRNEILKFTNNKNIVPSKVFFNVLDTMQVPHYFQYLVCQNNLHQAMMKTSAKYRACYVLGNYYINLLGAYSSKDKENILKRVEQFVDRFILNRFLVQSKIQIRVPVGQRIYIEENGELKLSEPLKSSDKVIYLGTRAGNASFKRLMELKIIPDLQQGKIGRNEVDLSILNNKFIQSLTSVINTQNPEYTVSINIAPNINMSPRSDNDKALFEEIKYDFNQLRSSEIRYSIGSNNYDLINLFWLYNQIAFGGRPGENSLTSIFTDVLDYKYIKEYRNYENMFDNNNDVYQLDSKGELLESSSILREITPKMNLWLSNLSYIYDIDPQTGKTGLWRKIDKKTQQELAQQGIYTTRGYLPDIISYDESDSNYILVSKEQDKIPLNIKLDSGEIKTVVSFGKITEFEYYPLDSNGNPDYSKMEIIKIPKDKLQYFENLPTKPIIDGQGTRLIYDVNEITQRLEVLINCG